MTSPAGWDDKPEAPASGAPGPALGVPAAQAIDAVKVYGRGDTAVRALDGVTVAFEAGHFTAIMGPSGSGKSTLMHCLAGLDSLTSGRVMIGATDLGTLKDRALTALRRDRIGFVFQSYNLVPTLSALENMTLPLALAGRKADQPWLDSVIDTLGLRDRLRHKPTELSGGQQQRVAVGRALATRPQIILADEPTGNLDSRAGGEMLALMRDSVNQLGQTVVMVTHDPQAAGYADRVVFLADGRIVDEMARTDRREGPRPHEGPGRVGRRVEDHAQGPRRPQAQAGADGHRGRARCGLHGRDVRADRHHQAHLRQPVRPDLGRQGRRGAGGRTLFDLGQPELERQ